jgi:hypothetical protein
MLLGLHSSWSANSSHFAVPLLATGACAGAVAHNHARPSDCHSPPRMTESDARQVLLVRAVETAPADLQGSWSAADSDWASDEARRRVGEDAGAERFLASRAGLALQRLGERDAAWRADPLRPGRGALTLVLLLGGGLLAGLIVGNVLGPERRINLLAPPVWGLLAWNLVVYAVLLVAGLRRWARSDRGGPAPPVWVSLVRRVSAFVAARTATAQVAAVRARHGADWALASAPLQAHRVAAVLHVAAALLAAAVVLSMYLFGLAFDFRAGWDSTWLDASQVQRALGLVFGPAAALGGIELPDAAALARLRWAEGSSGERAARWIHLYALTLAGVVILPRFALAAWAAWRARRAALRIELPLDEAYFRQLLRALPARPWPVTVLPYSYHVGAAQQVALGSALADALGPGAQAQVAPTLPLGAEDELARHLPALRADHVALLFSATATPERETHGAFAQAVAALRPAPALSVLIDESGLRRQFGSSSDGALRLRQRREAWQRLLQALSLPAPHFIDLQ